MRADEKMKSYEYNEWYSTTPSQAYTATPKMPLQSAFNGTDVYQNLPHDLSFNEGHVVTIVTYTILIIISTIGNVTVLTAMWRRRKKSRTRINTMLMHLAIADLLVSNYFLLRRTF